MQFTLTTDQAFEQVIEECAGPRRDHDDTWITTDMIDAYTRLHTLGVAHSVEVWTDDQLAGGIYGLSVGRVFFGESMFSNHADASKIALVALCRQLREWRFTLMDCQVSNAHLLSMGAEEITRSEFNQQLENTNTHDHWGQDFRCEEHW
jgi:leucyl/phenylalanyl-tRNA--protein transferase